MPIKIDHLSYAELKVLGALIEQRKRQLLIERRQEVRQKLIAEARSEGYTIDELFDLDRLRAQKGAVYSNPANPFQTWSGRGPRPKWLNQAIATGKTLEDLRIDS
jgi:DNA-binding protein H-NS